MTIDHILHVVGARPNLVKIAPIMRRMTDVNLRQTLVHTGQHYDYQMSQVFFEELSLPQPDVYLGVGSASHAVQTARAMMGLEETISQRKPDLVVVVGDVNSTLAAALVASKLLIPVAHIESGLRSNNRRMPEEINRIVTDAISHYLFTTERDANANLEREGIDPKRVHFVGNVMVDSLIEHRERALRLDVLSEHGLLAGQYALLTLHRPDNVDFRESLTGLLTAIGQVARVLPVLFPVHPRTQARIEEFGLGRLVRVPGFTVCPSLGYLPFLGLMARSAFVMTDSGGIQEETTALGIPCLTLRPETERPITVTEGTNTIIGSDAGLLLGEAGNILRGAGKKGRVPELWDGRAAYRIVDVVMSSS